MSPFAVQLFSTATAPYTTSQFKNISLRLHPYLRKVHFAPSDSPQHVYMHNLKVLSCVSSRTFCSCAGRLSRKSGPASPSWQIYWKSCQNGTVAFPTQGTSGSQLSMSNELGTQNSKQSATIKKKKQQKKKKATTTTTAAITLHKKPTSLKNALNPKASPVMKTARAVCNFMECWHVCVQIS